MASSSSSLSQSFSYDVFLSFRGEDTRTNFVDHLYKALEQQGIHTYKDDETLDRGESVGPALLKAIKESEIVVIVFSKNYADSSWCLDELAYIIECMETSKKMVMPVFYKIDPSNVRKLEGEFGKAFGKHESHHKVEVWRGALIKSGNLSGWVTNDFANRHEAKCIEDIVGTISGRLSQLTASVTNDFIGIETRLEDLKVKLEIGSGGVKMVGIWGVGGGGKTTLASAAYMEISHQFDAHCLLENIRDESSKHGLKKLQEKVLSLILKTKLEVGSEIEGRNMIKSRLRHKKVLLVLDDVDDKKQLEALAGSHEWFGDGSRIIITTRDKHLLSHKEDAIAIYEVSLLTRDEAIKLFDRHAKRENEPIEDYEKLSQDVVSYADGLPLALEILGSFLCDKNKDEWMSALAKLKCIPRVKVTERLKISYEGLEPDEKELFLDIACFFRRKPIDDAMRILDACSFHPGIGVKVLEQKSLIKISDGIFDMHDLIEEMAHHIVRGEHPNHPEKHSRIWLEKDIVELCAKGAKMLMENNHTEAIALRGYLYSFPSNVSTRLPDVVANMKKLRWIYWEGYPASSLPTHFQPTNLGCLTLIGGQQKQFWQGRKDLPNLKFLDLRYSNYLMTTPDFNGLPCLERLILEDCKKLTEIHPSIGYHERLVLVNMKGCLELKTFPPIVRMKSLETLDLSYCLELQKFPDIQTSLDSLANLHLDRTNIEIIPSSVGLFCTNLVYFTLRCCSNLKRIEGNFRLLKSLKVFDVFDLTDCRRLEKLEWDFFDKECCLEVLSLTIQTQLGWDLDLPLSRQTFPQFPRFLIKLDLSWCYLEDGDIPPDICELLNLQVLNLSGNNFSRLPSSLSQIPSLKLLDLSCCENLVELTDLPSSIAILKAIRCVSLERIGDLSNCKWLWKVSLKWSDKLIGGERARVLHSMLQVHAVEDRFMSVNLPRAPSLISTLSNYGDHFMSVHLPRVPLLISTLSKDNDSLKTSITLQLPHNWYSHYSGFLLCTSYHLRRLEQIIIIFKQGMSCMDLKPGHSEVFDLNHESSNKYQRVGYVPFGSLRHASWWNPIYTNISVEIHADDVLPKIVFVPRESKIGDSKESAIDCSEFWDEEEYTKTFEITDDTKSSILKIVWSNLDVI